MLEIVFSESAKGSLKVAQHCGESSSAAFVTVPILGQLDSLDDFQPAQQDECAMPAVSLGGKPTDIFCFSDDYSLGGIGGDALSEERMNSLQDFFSLFPQDLEYRLEIVEQSKELFEKLISRIKYGETLRIWYSMQPNEFCGICWLLTQLKNRLEVLPHMTAVKLPSMVRIGNTICQHLGWGGVNPEDFSKFLAYSEEVIPAFVTACTIKWTQLQQQDTVLRAVINGNLQSVPENFYDFAIKQELSQMEDEFSEAALIGRIIGKYQLGIGDDFIAVRIEKIIQSGMLSPIPKAEDSGYRRSLKKIK